MSEYKQLNDCELHFTWKEKLFKMYRENKILDFIRETVKNSQHKSCESKMFKGRKLFFCDVHPYSLRMLDTLVHVCGTAFKHGDFIAVRLYRNGNIVWGSENAFDCNQIDMINGDYPREKLEDEYLNESFSEAHKMVKIHYFICLKTYLEYNKNRIYKIPDEKKKECFYANIQESSLHPWKNSGDNPFVNISNNGLFFSAFDEKLSYTSVL